MPGFATTENCTSSQPISNGLEVAASAVWCSHHNFAERLLAISETDLKVKDWLVEQGGTNLKWVSFLDEAQITLGGIQPQRSGHKVERRISFT
jgi:hypothetical protein